MKTSKHANLNGYMIDENLLLKAVKEYKEKYVETGRAVGALSGLTGIHNSSHIIKDIKMSKDLSLQVDFEILKTPTGEVLKRVLDSCHIVPAFQSTLNSDGSKESKLLSLDFSIYPPIKNEA
jgi:hypothetical protein